MSSSATASNIKTGSVQSNIEKSVVLLNDPAHGCTHRRTSNIVPTDSPRYIVPTDIHGLSMVHCINRYPWTVHGTLYPQISMDCPWYIVSTDIHGLSMVHCIHRYPWTVHGTLYLHAHGYPWMSHTPHGGKSYLGIQCIHGYPWTVRAPHGGDGWEKLLGNTMYPWISMDCPRTPWGRSLEKLLGNTMYPWIAMDRPRTPWGRWLEKLLGNTMYPWISMDCPRTPWGRWLENYIVSMDPWTVHAPHGAHSMYCQISGFEEKKIRIAMNWPLSLAWQGLNGLVEF